MDKFKEWMKKAKEDLNAAKFTYKGKFYRVTAFFSQQAVEKALKSLQLKQTNRYDKIHDLVILARKLSLPKDIEDKCKEISPAYVYDRYPDLPKIKNIKGKSKELLSYAEEVLKWIENKL